ncbi:hypothetical protein J7E79_02600 [Bacillus sp. ISL-40]|uniref:hypothetical protein n=1 Tax=unclassified Bacillus (in: firmicutes) TaxID=185979 RepID=UPI001BE6009F|nr:MULTISPECIES: hypothetical protein [unclassified Bacillus (in: firmicutes)]MBT2696325.1 hypothetical protein [Bacillus sp. ISL-40]MBT2743174.1 hypothetical protein [Bacillus sp. ISL-77]
MAYEVIPLKLFLAPSYKVLSAVDGGLTFFLGLGTTFLVLIALEKFGVTINESLVRWVAYGGMGFGFVMLCLKMVLLVG